MPPDARARSDPRARSGERAAERPADRPPRPRRRPCRRRPSQAQPAPTAAAPHAAPPLPAPGGNGHPAVGAAEIQEHLLAIVSERTGYPADMLSLDADLEGDLGIDSIKRVEIAGTLSQTLALPDGATLDVEELTASRTLAQVIAVLEAAASSSAEPTAAAEPPPPSRPGDTRGRNPPF